MLEQPGIVIYKVNNGFIVVLPGKPYKQFEGLKEVLPGHDPLLKGKDPIVQGSENIHIFSMWLEVIEFLNDLDL